MEWQQILALIGGPLTLAIGAASMAVIRTITSANRIDALEVEMRGLAGIPSELDVVKERLANVITLATGTDQANAVAHARLEDGQQKTDEKIDTLTSNVLKAIRLNGGGR
jgi:hypothetical protein